MPMLEKEKVFEEGYRGCSTISQDNHIQQQQTEMLKFTAQFCPGRPLPAALAEPASMAGQQLERL